MNQIIVLGDVEMGAGTRTDDFIADKKLAQLILRLSRKHHPIDLVFNGDTFDFLKCPYALHPQRYTRYVSANIALKKLQLVHDAHPLVFEALKKFSSKKDKNIIFIRGNHDLEIAFTEVQEKLREMIGNAYFPGLFYYKEDVYIEHGQQYDITNFIHPNHTFIKTRDKKILNNTFVSFAIISALIPLKEEHPFLERIKPWPLILKLHHPLGKKVNRTIAAYFLKSAFYYPLRYYTDPTHSFPRHLVVEFVRRVRTMDWNLSDYLPLFKQKQRPHKVIVLGHIHDSMLEDDKYQVIIRPGTWRDEYNIDSKGNLHPLDKQYVEISMNGKATWRIIKIQNNRKVLQFYDVVKHEKEYMRRVREEEDLS